MEPWLGCYKFLNKPEEENNWHILPSPLHFPECSHCLSFWTLFFFFFLNWIWMWYKTLSQHSAQAFIVNLSSNSICHSWLRLFQVELCVLAYMCVLYNYLEELLKYIYLYVKLAFQNIRTTSRNRSLVTQYRESLLI